MAHDIELRTGRPLDDDDIHATGGVRPECSLLAVSSIIIMTHITAYLMLA